MKRPPIIPALALAAGWLTYAMAGGTIASTLAARWGERLVRLGEGKVVSPAEFLEGRMFEALWLTTLLLVWWLAHLWLRRWRNPLAQPRFAWLTHSVLAFLCLNLWLAQAQRTALFWGLMWHGEQTQNLTRFHLKLVLAREEEAASKAAIMGSSQARAQIDEALLNSSLAPSLRTTEFHYPGARAYDILLLHARVSKAAPKLIICYLSEDSFYSGSVTEVTPNFLTVPAFPDLIRRGGAKFIPAERIGVGLLGHVLPTFRLRDVLAQRILGPAITQIKQRQYDTALSTNLHERIGHRIYAIDDESRFQQRALEDFVARAGAARQEVILLPGQLNPILGQKLPPSVRADMIAFLRALAAKHPHVSLVEDLPVQTEQDYDDLTHVNKAAQARFTQFLAGRIEQHLARRAAPSR
jgi:hypothetical protein